MEYWSQHFVTEAYLKVWCDPQTPNGAFVWKVSKRDHKIFRVSPKSLFSEPDFYTVYDSNGNRELELEKKLKEVEDKFISLREKKLKNHEPVTPDDRKTIALFISTMYARTKRQKEDQSQIWKDYIQFIETLPPELSTLIKQTIEYKQVEESYSKQPMPFHMFYFVNMTAPYLSLMNCAIYETRSTPGFITSDNPCIWIDPTLVYPDETPTWFGLGSSKLNVILPISPNQCISLMRGGFDGYKTIGEEFVGTIEEFEVSNAIESIIINQKYSRESWFN